MIAGLLTFSELAIHLSAEDVEKVGWRRHAGNLHVTVLVLTVQLLFGWEDAWVFVAELQVPLHPSGRMFWSLAIVTMR